MRLFVLIALVRELCIPESKLYANQQHHLQHLMSHLWQSLSCLDWLYLGFRRRLLLDSRGVDVPMASNPTLVMLSSLKSLFFNSLKNE
jgi:hypothetical protein